MSAYLQPLAGAVSIFFAFIILLNRDNYECACPVKYGTMLNFSGVFTFGLLIGLSPCAPLLALLFDIVLMSKSAFDGMLYALSFGLGLAAPLVVYVLNTSLRVPVNAMISLLVFVFLCIVGFILFLNRGGTPNLIEWYKG